MATETEVQPYSPHHGADKRRSGRWCCQPCGVRLKDSLEIRRHLDRRSGCTVAGIVFICDKHGLEEA